jgi:hypothetical protein
MTNIDSNPFIPVSPPTTEMPAAERPKRGPRKAKADAFIDAVTKPARKPRVAKATASDKPGRKPRVAKVVAAKPGKLGINEIVSATVGLKEDEAAALLNIVQSLGDLKKSAKPKVLAALGKLFG